MNRSHERWQLQLLERQVEDRVLAPVFVIEMPPFRFVHGEIFAFHDLAQQVATLRFILGPTLVVGIRAFGHFIVAARHLHFPASLQIIEAEINGASAIMHGAFGWVSDELMLVRRSAIPKHLGDIPWAVAVVDDESVAERLQLGVGSNYSLGGRTL